MRADRIREGETPEKLSARTGFPVCALMRKNRVLSPAWLFPGREIALPEPGFCAGDAFPCPSSLVNVPARSEPLCACIVCAGDTVASLSGALGVPERLVLLALGRRSGELTEGERFLLNGEALDARIETVLPGETLASFSARTGANEELVARINRLRDGRVAPGMRLSLGRAQTPK